jgi:hypothetical protein
MVHTPKSFPQIFRFPKKILNEELALAIYLVHGHTIGKDEPATLDCDILQQLEEMLDEKKEYCLHTTKEVDDLPCSVVINPLIFNKPITVFMYGYTDPCDTDSNDSYDSYASHNIVTVADVNEIEKDVGDVSDCE